MCQQDLRDYFGLLIVFIFFLWIALALTNMIFSILNPKEFDTFIEANYTADFKNTTNYELLLDLNFGTELQIKYDFDIMGTVNELCYIGICNLDSTNKVTKNCSDSCLTPTKYCYDGENRCNSKKCIISSEYNKNSSCHQFNRIQFWRNVEYFRNIGNYKVTPYYDIIPKDQDCRYGYKKCGIINENKDYLCIKKGKVFDCPINDIIVKSNNETIEEGYRSFKLGDKFLFVSNDKTDNYIIKNLSITLDINKTSPDLIKVDNDTYENFSIYNYIYLDSIDQPELAFLNAVPFKSNFTYEEMMKKQGIIDKKKETYTKEKLYELNSEVHQYKKLLFAFGIAIFCILVAYTIFICVVLSYDCFFDCLKNTECHDCSLFSYILGFYFLGSPIIIMLIYSFILTIKKKIIYNKLSSMEYIEEYKNLLRLVSVDVGISYPHYEDRLIPYDFFENSITYNNVQFILLLIILILLIVYPVVVLLFCHPPEEKEKKIYSYNSNTGVNGECSEMCSKPMNDQMNTPS